MGPHVPMRSDLLRGSLYTFGSANSPMRLRFCGNVPVFVPPSWPASYAEIMECEPDAEQQFHRQCYPTRIALLFRNIQAHLVANELSLLPIRLMRNCASAGLFTEQPYVPPSPYADNT